MKSEAEASPGNWGEENSQLFIDYGRYFVPQREQQIDTICSLIPSGEGPFNVLELCCGEGLLAKAILSRFANSRVIGLDGSPEMLEKANAELDLYGDRFEGRLFDLADHSWRSLSFPVQAVVSSLAIHHLDGEQKRALYTDINAILSEGGVLIISDVIQPAGSLGTDLAANAWDQSVRGQSLELAGNLDAFEFFQREKWNMYRYLDPQDIDKPSPIYDQLKWLEGAGYAEIDVYWMHAGHAIFGGRKPIEQ